jgi:hypothetical protein
MANAVIRMDVDEITALTLRVALLVNNRTIDGRKSRRAEQNPLYPQYFDALPGIPPCNDD